MCGFSTAFAPDETDHCAWFAEPGGYLQWDEVDVGAYQAHSPSATISKAASQGMVEHFLAYVDACGFKFE